MTQSISNQKYNHGQKKLLASLRADLHLLDHLALKAQIEAKQLFPDHPKAQKVWVKLKSGNGGIDPVVEVLGLQGEYYEYSKAFYAALDRGNVELACIHSDSFCKFCKEQVMDKFYLFV